MIAVRSGPDIRFAVVETPQDLISHACHSLRLPTYGGLYAWEFEKGGRELKVRVEGPLVFNSI